MSSRFMNWPVASAPGSQYHHEASWNILKLMRSQLVKPQNPRFFWSPTRDQAQWLMLSLKLMQKKNMQSPIFWGMCMYIYIHTYNYIYTYVCVSHPPMLSSMVQPCFSSCIRPSKGSHPSAPRSPQDQHSSLSSRISEQLRHGRHSPS